MRRSTVWLLGLGLALCTVGARAAAPDYPHGDFTGDCATCHTPDRWSPAKVGPEFEHKESFPLRGAHKTTPCRSCHQTLDFANTPAACVDCHSDVHLGELGTDCARCHTPVNFLDRSQQLRDHRATRFPLQGAHVTQDCESCHKPQPQGTPTWVGVSIDCSACHLAQYQATTHPDHVAAGFPTECAMCHTPTDWSRARFDHAGTAFPLTGAHRTVVCASCHAGGYASTPTACVACHQADYNGTTDPDHVAGSFPTECTGCHTTAAWSPASFNHATTAFPLTGAHTTVACASCHAGGYSGTPTACVACHQADYNGASDPNHVAAGFPTACTSCHNTAAWSPASFNHATSAFPLTGAHTTVACASCHAGGYSGTPTACVACHQADYNTTTDPNHANAGFPTDCALCHTTTTFSGGSFTQHDAQYFPIYSGTHRNHWDRCTDCHTQPANYATFSCFLCHGQSETNGHHNGVSGYSYNSNLCYQCHPQGRN